MAQRNLPRWLAPCAVAAAAVAAYANTLALGFTLDDFTLIVDNPNIGNPGWLLSLFLKPLLWRPLKRLSLAIDWRIWGLDHPAGFHATNVVLHAAACVALWAVAIRLGFRRGAALAAALLFALHPVHVEAVANISHRKEPMALLFCLLGFLAYLRGREPDLRPRTRALWVTAAALAYLCGMLSKEVGAVMLPVAIVVHECFVVRDPWAVRRARLAAFVPALSAVVLLFTVRGYIGTLGRRFGAAQIRWATDDRASDYATIVRIAVKAFGENVGLLLEPWPLYFDRAFTIPASFFEPGILAGIAAAIVLLYGLVISVRRFPAVFFGLAWFGLFLLPVSGVIPLTYWYIAERFLYAPSAGIALVTGVAVERAWRTRRAGGWMARGAFVALLACYLGLTVVQNRVWRDQESLYSHTIQFNPGSSRALYGLGLVRQEQGNRAAAADLYQRSIRASADYGEPYYALALLRLDEGRPDEAIALAQSAARWMDDDPQPLLVIGNAQMQRARYAEAVDAYRRAHELDPADADVLLNLGAALEAEGDSEAALRAFEDAIALDPAGPEAIAAKTDLLERMGPQNDARKSVEPAPPPRVR